MQVCNTKVVSKSAQACGLRKGLTGFIMMKICCPLESTWGRPGYALQSHSLYLENNNLQHLYFSEDPGEKTHHPREESAVCVQGEGGVKQAEPSILCSAVFHFPGQRKALYLCHQIMHPVRCLRENIDNNLVVTEIHR